MTTGNQTPDLNFNSATTIYIDENATVSIDFLASDYEGAAHLSTFYQFSMDDLPILLANGNISSNDNSWLTSDLNAATGISAATLNFLAPDFENPIDGGNNNIYHLTVMANDGVKGATATFTFIVRDINDGAPTAINLSNQTVAENAGDNKFIANLSAVDPDRVNSFTYSLVAGEGDADNSAYKIVGNQLQLINSANYETKTQHSIRLRVSDEAGNSFITTKVIDITDVAEAPQQLALSAKTVLENAGNNAVIGTFSAYDPDQNSALSYTLLNNANERFALVGNKLVVKNGLLLDHEQSSSHVISVKVSDGEFSRTEFFTITVQNNKVEKVIGNTTNNTVIGGSGADNFNGGAGDDVLSGKAGIDKIYGGSGKDRIVGGAGKDYLSGGSGADIFDFDSVKDTGKTKTTRDVISDFKHSNTLALSDRIDLSTIDANGSASGHKFTWLGDKAFNGKKGALHFKYEGTTKTIVEGDINGDKIADFQIELLGKHKLVAADFIL